MANNDRWIGSRSGTANLWNDPANWSRNVPSNASDASIGAPGTYTVVINAGDRPLPGVQTSLWRVPHRRFA